MVIAAATETLRGERSHAVGAHVAKGHGCWRSRPDVRCASNSDRFLRRSKMTLCAKSDRRTAAAFYSISSNSTRIRGSHLQMEEPSTASGADRPLKVDKSSDKW